jgi:hypothetical protein
MHTTRKTRLPKTRLPRTGLLPRLLTPGHKETKMKKKKKKKPLRHTASLQAQSKAPDIYSLRESTEELLASLNAQAQAPDDPSQILASDFHLLSLHAYMEELSDSFNVQDQSPDDLHSQDRQYTPCIFDRQCAPCI